MKYKHLTIEEREIVQRLIWEEKSIRYIANTLKRSPSSISREIKRNNPKLSKRYTPRKAHERAKYKRKCRGRKERLKNNEIRDYVISKLKLRWSPEQIAGRIKLDINQSISHEAVYQFIYYQIHRDGYGYLKTDCIDLRGCLRRRRKRRIRKGLRNTKPVSRFNGHSIEERPKIVDLRTRIGDWETDTVESTKGSPGVNTLLERRSGLYFITKLEDKTNISTYKAIYTRLKDIPTHTLTMDNGGENACWRLIEETMNINTYHCHPYCSGERGANENTNGLFRDFFPKGTNFVNVSNTAIQHVENLLNNRPRKRLGWKTPLEVFNESVALRG